jgi:hypothetical protein
MLEQAGLKFEPVDGSLILNGDEQRHAPRKF